MFKSMRMARAQIEKNHLPVCGKRIMSLFPPLTNSIIKIYVLRRILNPMGVMDAIDFLLDKLRNTKSNGEFFESMNT
jgi:transcription termination factor Rho